MPNWRNATAYDNDDDRDLAFTLMEGLFLELKHVSLQNKLIIGNVYKLPRDNNNANNIDAFTREYGQYYRNLVQLIPKFLSVAIMILTYLYLLANCV